MSRLALFSRRAAVFALALGLLGMALNHAEKLETTAAVATFMMVVALAALAVLAAIGGIVRIWHRGHLGLAQALAGLLLGSAILAGPAYLSWETVTKPMINDIATDWTNPPVMPAAVRDRSKFANALRHPTPEEIAAQAEAYPEIGPLVVNMPSQRVYEAARALVRERGWRILDEARPDERGPGRLEMVARTPVLGFKDDVAVAVTNLGEGRTRVDMRSASRIGRHDFGKNAERIYGFLTDLDERLRSSPLL
ncbi:hypothetical protein N177_0346 [Lutibaculum baratangense AMV1]|uniref:DUF1499 domain-containing protein n=1 Tax=Lutibaculum baratangense AMV1 TaxID=631454 RepID=V4TMW0_9HYPH|nr:hypothetical protein N177_0346 [Lutibaculum baratangense AMV1]